jgi:hypothetical protein
MRHFQVGGSRFRPGGLGRVVAAWAEDGMGADQLPDHVRYARALLGPVARSSCV